MIFPFAGHNNVDPGAVANGYTEAALNKELRDLVCKELDARKYAYIKDKDSETLSQLLGRIKPGSGSVIGDIHFNASANVSATGVEVLYPDNCKLINKTLAGKMAAELASVMGIPNRGAKNEKQSARGKLAALRTPAGISFLIEVCFINNPSDMAKYQANKVAVAKVIAKYLIIAEDKFY